MIIENVEALRIWLTDKLKPICDADPSALAKYVVALIKKEKPVNELQDVCMDQLDVFLGDDTKLFVSKLFEALENQSYLPTSQLLIQPNKEATEDPVIEITSKTGEIETLPDEEEVKESKSESIDEKTEEVNKETDRSRTEQQPNQQQQDWNRKRRSTGDYNRPQRFSRRGRQTNFFDHSNVKRPRNDSERSMSRGRPGKSLSPPSRRSPRKGSSPGRRHRSRRERRRRSEERRSSKRRGRCRDYEEKGFCMLGDSCPYDHGRDPVIFDDHNLPGMLRLPGLPVPVAPVPQIPELFPGIPPLSGSNIIANPAAPGISSLGLRLDTGLTLVPGQQWPVPTPTEVPVKISVLADPQPALAEIKPAVSEVKENADESAEKSGTSDNALQGNGNEAYNPEEPSIDVTEPSKVPVWLGQQQKLSNAQTRNIYSITNEFPPTSITAEEFLRKMYTPSSVLLPPAQIPVQPLANTLTTVLHPPIIPAMPMLSSSLPITLPAAISSIAEQTSVYNPPRRPFMNQTILEIRKIPKENNTVVKISEYFQKFGNIVNIQVHFDNDPQAALVQFATNMEARRAYSCPEAVLGNRFIKLFWHNKTKDFPTMSNSSQLLKNVNNTVSTNITSGSMVKTSSAAEEPGAEKPRLPSSDQTTYVNPENTPQAVQRKKAEMKKEALKKKLEIQKQRQSLLEKQIKEQKVLITKLEKNKNMSSTEKELLMNALKTLTNSIDKLRSDINSQTKVNKPMSKQAMQKELLDREIELYNKQFAAGDSLDAKKAPNDLEKEARLSDTPSAKSTPIRGRGRMRGRGRGQLASRGRGQGVSRAVIDNRPKQILVTGYDEIEKDAVVAQFASFGEIDRVEEKPGGKLVLSFHTRKQAEIAATKAAVFKGRKLVLAWYNAAQNAKRNAPASDAPAAKIQRRTTRSSSVSSLLSKDDKDDDDLLGDLDDKEADLLLLEEDEEEDLEERSWKR